MATMPRISNRRDQAIGQKQTEDFSAFLYLSPIAMFQSIIFTQKAVEETAAPSKQGLSRRRIS